MKLPETWECVHIRIKELLPVGGAGHSHVGETVARGHHQMPMRQRSSGSNPQVRKEQGREGHATYEEPLLLPHDISQALADAGGSEARLDIQKLDKLVREYFAKG